MNNSKLVNLLRTFSKHEIKELEKIVASPYFNRGRNYAPLLKQLKKFHPKFDDPKMTPEYIFLKMYPGKKINMQTIWNMSSALLKMAEEFLALGSLKKKGFLREQQIAEELHSRKLPQYYSKKLDEMENELERPGISPNYFHFKMQLEGARKEYYYIEEKQSLIPEHDDKEGEYLILYFLWSIVRVLNDMHVHSFMFNASYDVNVTHEFIKNVQLKKIINYCNDKKYGYAWLMEMLYNQIMMILEPDDGKYFSSLKELFEKNYNRFTDEAKLNWVTSLINYCSAKRDYSSRKTLFEIHKFELKEGMAFTGKYLSKAHYLQILKNACAIKENEWIKNFINECAPKLKPSYQKSMRALGLAFLYLNLKHYDKVFESLGKIRFIDIKDKLTVKFVYIRAYYESKETEALLSHIDTTLHFINNNSASIRSDIALNYRNSLKAIKKLIAMGENNEYSDLEHVKKTIEGNTDMVLGDWLLEKIDELSINLKNIS